MEKLINIWRPCGCHLTTFDSDHHPPTTPSAQLELQLTKWCSYFACNSFKWNALNCSESSSGSQAISMKCVLNWSDETHSSAAALPLFHSPLCHHSLSRCHCSVGIRISWSLAKQNLLKVHCSLAHSPSFCLYPFPFPFLITVTVSRYLWAALTWR